MAIPLFELARTNTGLRGGALHHAQRLVASWQPLADLCFSDLLFLAPVEGEEGQRFVVLAHVRPHTGQTLYPGDLVGTVVHEHERPLIARAWRRGEILGGDTAILGGKERARVQCIALRYRDRPIGVVTRESATTSGRRPGELERHYVDVFDHLARMLCAGTFPFPRDEVEIEEAPRVADGLIVLDDELKMRFASPNAVSTLHRMGIHAYTEGLQLAEVGLDQGAAEAAVRMRLPVSEEIERGEISVLLKAIPLLEGGGGAAGSGGSATVPAPPVDGTGHRSKATGAVVLLRDVTDLRRRDRILMSKDATIREIHHRVKNNLQTIAALLRLQGRRLESPEAQEAIEESERRIRSIAIVHEMLSRDVGDVVPFDDIVHQLVRVVEETVSTPEQRLRFEVDGGAGELPGELATPLAVVLNELMQNVVDHAFPRGSGDDAAKNDDGAASEEFEGHVRVGLDRDAGELIVSVVDDGVGLPPGFSLDQSQGLGLSIVQALVTGELSGSIDMRDDNGTHVHLRIPLRQAERIEL